MYIYLFLWKVVCEDQNKIIDWIKSTMQVLTLRTVLYERLYYRLSKLIYFKTNYTLVYLSLQGRRLQQEPINKEQQ